MPPAKTQISLCIRPVWSGRPGWSESSLCAQRVAKDPSFLYADSEDSNQTGRMPRLIWVFTGRTSHFVGFVMRRLECFHFISVTNIWNLDCHGTTCMILKFNAKHILSHLYLSPVKRICVFEHSVMTNFNCACPAIQRGQGSGFLSEGSSWLTVCMSEQRRFWWDCADVQARLNLRCSHRR